MSYDTFFMFASGLSKTLLVPPGTKDRMLAHVAKVEATLGLKTTQFKDNPPHWNSFDPAFRDGFPDVPDELLCETVENHNERVRCFHADLGKWSRSPVEGGEELTPEDAKLFWHGLQMLDVEPNRWTSNYYRARMDALYEVMRGRPSEGMDFDTKALTVKQAAAVINLFSQYLNDHQLNLDVPRDRDYLASSYDGGYDWCEKCGCAVHPDDIGQCKKRKCPLREEDE